MLFNVCLHSHLFMLRADWRKSDSRWGATGELDLEFKFPRRGCKLSFFFPPCHQSGLGIVQCLFNLFQYITWGLFGKQGWRSGESTCLPSMWFKSRHRCHMWVEFCCWFSPLLLEVFLRVLWFSPLLKNQHFQIPIRSGTHGHI